MAQKPMDRRKTLFKLVSDLTDADVLSSDPRFQPLADQLAQFTSEEIMSRDKKALSENKKELEEIPTRIDEVSKSIVEQDYTAAGVKLQDLREQLAYIEDDVSDTALYEQVNQLKSEIVKYKSALQDIERDANAEIVKSRKDVQCKIIDTDQALTRTINQVTYDERQLDNIKNIIVGNKERLNKLGEDYKTEKSKDMADGTNICPVCHQEYPESMKESMRAAFETEKERKLKEINLNGKSVKDAILSYESQIAEYEDKIEAGKKEIERLNSQKMKLQHELEALPVLVDLSSNSLYEATKNSLINAEMNLETSISLTKDSDARKKAIQEQKRAIQSEIDTVNRVLSGKQMVENAKLRVEELKAEQRRLSQDIASTEREIYLLEEFNKAKVNLLSDKINAHFRVVRWKLFERQINGGYNPVCEPMVNGQSYSSALNSGHKILAELDIIQALQRIYDVSVPVFLDNAERINDFNIPDMNCQLITLSVTEDPELKVVNE
jgi:chromosome segregation ATPase